MADRGKIEPHFVLASGSPRRRDILNRLNIDPFVFPVDVDETAVPDETATALVARLATAKAEQGWERFSETDLKAELDESSERSCVVLGADTVVDLDGKVLGKPNSDNEARDMLESLSGRSHQVRTGLTLCVNGPEGSDGDWRHLATVETTKVTFQELESADIDWYLSTGEGSDKAGAYGVQGLGALLVDKVDGCFFNVVGLPLGALDRLFRRAGWPLRSVAQ